MRKFFVFLLFALDFIMLSAQPIDHHRWNDRLILIFNSEIDGPSIVRQMELFQNQEPELQDRDLFIYQISPTGVKNPDGQTDHKTAKWFYDRYGISKNTFQVLLIGKDGGEKLRADNPIAPEKIFALIDTMPMRRAEMRRKKFR